MEVEDRVADLLGRMTPEEKIAQLGAWFSYRFLGPDRRVSSSKLAELAADGLGQVSGATMIGGDPASTARASNSIQRHLVEETRLGIPAIFHNEALCGLMYGPASAFPTAINLAATWEPALVYQMADLTRRQMRAVGIHQALSPVLDVARDARWGRVHETYGEDPVLCAAFGVAFVEGLQGEDLRDGVVATGKHFLAYGLSEGALNQAAVHLGPRELYEVFALPFEAAIRDADLVSIMCSYSEIDGVPVAASRETLTGLLRAELGFGGFVVADYHAVGNNLNKHQVAIDERDAAIQALDAGVDIELPELRCYATIVEAMQNGALSGATVDLAVARVLDAKFRLGLFDTPYCDEDDAGKVFVPDPGVDLAREITGRSLVLLANDGTLPLSSTASRKIAVVGPFANSLRLMFAAYTAAGADELGRTLAAGRSGAAPDNESERFEGDPIGQLMFGTRERGIPDDVVEQAVRDLYPEMRPLLEELQDRAGSCEIDFVEGCPVLDRFDTEIDHAISIAHRSDLVLCALGEKSGWVGQATGGEGRDRSSLELPGHQADLLRAMCATNKPTVLVLFSGRPLEIDCPPSAVLWAGAPGRYGPSAIADVLFGHTNPGGKLPITFPRRAGQTPQYSSHKVGSGDYSTTAAAYIDSEAGPRYPFGHGLSYTTFALSDLVLSRQVVLPDETFGVGVTVENTGRVAGSEVVQVYLHDRNASVTRPVRQLAGFVRVDLEAGERLRINFDVAVAQLALLDRQYRLVIEPGAVDVMVGTSSQQLDLRGEVVIDGETVALESRGPFFAEATVEELLATDEHR